MSADTARRGPLTWGQSWPWLDAARPARDRDWEAPRVRCPLPEGVTEAQVRAAIREVVDRSEGMRATVHIGPDGAPYQELLDADAIPVDVLSVLEPDSRYDVAQRYLAGAPLLLDIRYRPVAVAIVCDGGVPVEVLWVLTHVSSDAYGALVVRDLFLAVLAGTAAPRPDPSPLDDAAAQASPAGRERDAQAAQRRAGHRRILPHTLFPVTRPASFACPGSRARLSSPALALAAELLARRHRVPTAVVYVAAYAVALWVHTGVHPVGVDLVGTCRSTPERRRMVSSTVLPAIAPVEIRPGERFTELLRRAAPAVLEAFTFCEGDHNQRMLTDVSGCHERGIHFFCNPEFNLEQPAGRTLDPTRLTGAAIRAALGASRGSTGTFDWCFRLRLEILVHRGRADLELRVPAELIAPDVSLDLLRDFETVLVRATGDDPTLRDLVPDLAGRPPVRGPEWAHVDNCWVRPGALADLLGTHPDIAGSAVFLDPDAGRLTAYLVPRRDFLDLGRLHRWLVTAVTREVAAMAAHRYVECTRVPDDPTDEAAWQRMPVVAVGDGRGPVSPATQPRTDRQRLLLDAVHRLAAPDAQLDDCYPLTGGRLDRVPAVIAALDAAGWTGLCYWDFASTRSLLELADSLAPVPADAAPDIAPALVGAATDQG